MQPLKADHDLLYAYLPLDTARQTTALREALSIIEREFGEGVCNTIHFLDLGCGAGNSFDTFRKSSTCIEWLGMDITVSQEVNSRTRCDATFISYDGINIPLRDASMDIVYSHQVFEHVRRPSELLPQAFRVLKPGGWLVGSTSHLEPYHSRSHWNYTPYGFSSLLNEAGFSDVRVRPGIDGLTLILRRLLSYAKIQLGPWFFEHESPLNVLIEVSGRISGMEIRKRAILKLLFCGHFIFIARKPYE